MTTPVPPPGPLPGPSVPIVPPTTATPTYYSAPAYTPHPATPAPIFTAPAPAPAPAPVAVPVATPPARVTEVRKSDSTLSRIGLLVLGALLGILVLICCGWLWGNPVALNLPRFNSPITIHNGEDTETSVVPAGAYRLTKTDLNRACQTLYGAGSTAKLNTSSDSVPSYWYKCDGDADKPAGLDEYCTKIPGRNFTHAENPYRFDADSSTLHPYDHWYCYP